MPVRCIGIGVSSGREKVIQSVLQAGVGAEVIVYCEPGGLGGAPSIPVREDPRPGEALVKDLYGGSIDAAVRGTLPSGTTLRVLKQAAGVTHLERAALIELDTGRKFLLAPVGIDEGWTVAGKVAMARRAKELATTLGLEGEVGILSGGRLNDAGRHPRVDETLAQAELVARLTGFHHYEILIEEAAKECSVIIAPDGISGNLIFRTLALLGNARGHGAPVMNIDRVFIDTSRASPDYANALRLAEMLAGKRKNR
ncbi:MAG: methanogenesis marker protein Mmp4/MtxX [Methanolinea sp.]|nr:methanogenesis marker protein Mmp4/MtxX [Methanolinea sp.]